jgi:hypothetical protein
VTEQTPAVVITLIDIIRGIAIDLVYVSAIPERDKKQRKPLIKYVWIFQAFLLESASSTLRVNEFSYIRGDAPGKRSGIYNRGSEFRQQLGAQVSVAL